MICIHGRWARAHTIALCLVNAIIARVYDFLSLTLYHQYYWFGWQQPSEPYHNLIYIFIYLWCLSEWNEKNKILWKNIKQKQRIFVYRAGSEIVLRFIELAKNLDDWLFVADEKHPNGFKALILKENFQRKLFFHLKIFEDSKISKVQSVSKRCFLAIKTPSSSIIKCYGDNKDSRTKINIVRWIWCWQKFHISTIYQ